MNRVIILFLILTASLQIVKGQSTDSISTRARITQQELANSKTQLEIDKLKKELTTNDHAPWLQTGTFVAALVAAAISLITATRSQKIQSKTLENQITQQQKERISVLLKDLSSVGLPIKLASIRLRRIPADEPDVRSIIPVEFLCEFHRYLSVGA